MKFNSTSFFRVFFSTRLKSLIAAAFFLTQIQTGFSQNTGIYYTWSSPGAAYTANSSPNIIGAAGDDNVVYPIAMTAATWSGFNYAGKDYGSTATIYVSSNGWISFQNPGGNSYPT